MLKRYLIASFDKESGIRRAVVALRNRGIAIYDTYTPYAVHGLDEAMGVRRTRLAWVTLAAGFLGCLLALLFQICTSAFDWPVNVGGKPGNSWPAFIPVTFELTVLIGGLTTVAAFFVRDRLLWGRKPHLTIEGVTDDVFALVVENPQTSWDVEAMEQQLYELGATKITEQVTMP